MKISQACLLAAAFGALLASGGCLSSTKDSSVQDWVGAVQDRRALSEATIAQWADLSALAARRTMEEYGVPDEVHSDHLIWNKSGPWKRTVVRNVRPAFVEGDELGIIEQTLDYAVSGPQAVDIAAFDDRVSYNARARELSARSDAEEYNFLRMNLANDVIIGNLRPEQARESYARIVSFEQSGKTSPYLLGLHFSPDL